MTWTGVANQFMSSKSSTKGGFQYIKKKEKKKSTFLKHQIIEYMPHTYRILGDFKKGLKKYSQKLLTVSKFSATFHCCYDLQIVEQVLLTRL